jgi:hypothetical protein
MCYDQEGLEDGAMEHVTGGCFCKGVRFTLTGPTKHRAHCHGESCRRATSSPFTTWFTVDRKNVKWAGLAPTVYHSSPGVTRSFCPRCGSPLSYETAERPGDIDLYAAALDDHGAFKPTKHVLWSEHVPWVELGDDLPREG